MLDVSDAIVSRLVWVGKIPTARLARRIQLDAQDLGAFILHSKPRGSSSDRVAELGGTRLGGFGSSTRRQFDPFFGGSTERHGRGRGGERNADAVHTLEKKSSRNRASDSPGLMFEEVHL